MKVHGPLTPASLVLPLILLLVYVAFTVYCVNDLYQPNRRVLGFSKDIWAIIIVVVGIVGGVFYLIYGRDSS